VGAASVASLVMAGIAFYVGHFHLIIYVQRKQHREDLFFALTCLACSLYDVTCAGLYSATSVSAGAAWVRGQFVVMSLFSTALVWFIREHAAWKRRWFVWVYSAFSLLALAVQAIDRTGFTWILEHPSVKEIVLPFGLRVTYYEPGTGPFSLIQMASAVAACGYGAWTAARAARRSPRAMKPTLAIALGLFFAAALNDTAVNLTLYRFIYLIEYSYFILVVVMSFALSRAVVGGAMAEERYRILVESSPTGIFLTNGGSRFELVNDEVCRITGYTRDEIRGMDVHDLLLDDARHLVVDRQERRQQGNPSPSRCDATLVRKDGARRVIELATVAFKTPRGAVHAMGHMLDVTDRRATEAALRQAHTVVLNSPAVVFRWRYAPGYPVELASENVSRFGFTADALLSGQVLYRDLIHPDDFGHVSEEVDRYLAAGLTSFRQEYRIANRNGRIHWVEDLTVVETDAHGVVTHLQGVVVDVTERVALERESEERREYLERILATVPDAIVTMDPQYRIREWNPGAERLFGYAREQMIGQTIDRLRATSDEPISTDAASWMRLVENGHPVPPTVTIGSRRDGTSVDILVAVAPIFAGAERIGTVAICSDITEQKRAQNEIRRLNAALEARVQQRTAALLATNKELEDFACSVSHDLRAPLRTMEGFGRALEEDCGPQLDAAGRQYVSHIRTAARRMGELIEALLSLSRIATAEMNPSTIDLSSLARTIAADLARRDHGRSVEFDVADGLNANGDPRLIRAALEKLLENAGKFTAHRATARVEVGQEAADGEPAFYVRDNGAGFEMAYAARLFQAFKRLHRADEFPGVGRGLATVQRIIHRHGGRVWAEGRVDRGATFWFTLAPGTRP